MKSSILAVFVLLSTLFGFSLFGSKVSTENILAVSLQENFCKLNKYKRECRNFKQRDFFFTLHGLWPQPRNKQNCSNKIKRIDQSIWEELKIKMPGIKSGLHKHEWRKHGSCYGKDENGYFADALKLLDEVNRSYLREFFAKNKGRVITKTQLNQAVKKAFGNVARKVQMVCKKGLITELRFSLKGRVDKHSLNELLKDAKPLRGGCQRGRI